MAAHPRSHFMLVAATAAAAAIGLSACCRGPGGSLDGAGFTPNIVFAATLARAYEEDPSVGYVVFQNAAAPEQCLYDGGFIGGGSLLGQLILEVHSADGGAVGPGSFPVLDSTAPGSAFAHVTLYGPTVPLSSGGQILATGSLGTVNLIEFPTDVDEHFWRGNFSANLSILDGGFEMVSGSFDADRFCGGILTGPP